MSEANGLPDTQMPAPLLMFRTIATHGSIVVYKPAIAWTPLFVLHQDIGHGDNDFLGGWTISHRLTGFALLRSIRLERAREAFVDLIGSANVSDWESDDVQRIVSTCRAFRKAFQAKWREENHQ